MHVLREIVNAVLSAVAQERKRLTATAPTLPRGRPGTKAARRAARRKKRIETRVGELFAHRHLFVQRRLTAAERRTLLRITRGLPQLRTLRALMGDVGAPAGVGELGYTEDDVPALAEGAMKQQRLLAVAPREAGEEDLRRIIQASL